jgi:hypothetical protein
MIQGGEYVPTTVDEQGKELGQNASFKLYSDMYANKRQAESLGAQQCVFTKYPQASFESLHQQFSIDCPEATVFALPVSYSRYMRVYQLVDGVERPMQFFRKPTDPRVLVTISGEQDIVVYMPTFGQVLLGRQ